MLSVSLHNTITVSFTELTTGFFFVSNLSLSSEAWQSVCPVEILVNRMC